MGPGYYLDAWIENPIPCRLKFNKNHEFWDILKISKIQYQGLRLVYVHSNPRLLDSIQAVNYTETTVEWEQWAVADSDSE